MQPQPLENPRRERFAHLVAGNVKPCDAYVIAGFETTNYESTAAASTRLMRESEVIRRVREIIAPQQNKNRVTVERLLEEYASLAYSNIDDCLTVDESGQPKFDYAAMTREQRAALAEVTVEEYVEGRGDDARQVKRVKFKMHDKRAAMNDLARYLKIIGNDEPRVNVSVQILASIKMDDREALVSALASMIPAETLRQIGGPVIEGDVVKGEDGI